MAKEDLEPLDVAAADLDLVFYSYVNRKDEPREYTLGDYKAHFRQDERLPAAQEVRDAGRAAAKIVNELSKTS